MLTVDCTLLPNESEGAGDDLFPTFSPRKGEVVSSQKTRAELIAENEVMRHRLETTEKRPGKERRSNNFLRIFIDALSKFGFSFDANGRILQVLTGGRFLAHVLEGRLLTELLPQIDAEELGGALRKTFETREVQDFEFTLSVLTDRRWYRVKIYLGSDQTGEEKFVVFLFQDVTNEKLAEDVLKNDKMELAQQKAGRGKNEGQF